MAEKNNYSRNSKSASNAGRSSNSGGKQSNAKSGGKSTGRVDLAARHRAKQQERSEIPNRLINAIVAAALFVLFLVIFLNPDGALIELFYKFLLGVVGKISFYVSIPALLYLFFVQAFSGTRPVVMRSWCILAFVLISGCLSHLFMEPADLRNGIALLGDLYMGGIDGKTGGFLCGSIAMILQWLCGKTISIIVLIVAAVFTLLGSMQITIPSLVRAVQNRPRADWEDEIEEKPEPAAMVVNHIATKRIEHMESKRRTNTENYDMPMDDEPPRKSRKKSNITVTQEPVRTIDLDPEKPRKKTPQPTAATEDDSIFAGESGKKSISDGIPADMIDLDMDSLGKAEPKVEAEPEKVTAKEAAESAAQVAQEIAENEQVERPVYCFPPIELLKRPKAGVLDGNSEMRENTRRLNETLASFKIEAHIINVTRGPSVTRYEVELDKGVRLNKLTTMAEDIALNLGASGVRIAAVPGKISVVGIEVPNQAVTTVSLREVIDSPAFANSKSKSSFAVGKDISGNCIVGNISKLPHMLIAGTTGSGKSVCMNSIIISLLYKASPDDVKLIMVDPKMVELGIYNSIPHLMIPVVTDPKKAAGSLQWAVTEMLRRYKAMSDEGVRDLEAYNAIMEHEEHPKLPQIVVIIDELADLMLAAAKEVEESICRIAQMGRASGIHLIIATQRPSADVITGLMKANIPSRIAFAVASAMESRIILDTTGAEKLVGKGDMLFAPIGSGKPVRVQGCFVTDDEVEAVASYVKENFMTEYDEGVMEEIEKKAAQTGSSKSAAAEFEANEAEMEGDEMLPAAVDVILETGQASVSLLQRRLKLGYARAARIVDEMEELGVVGPFQGSKPRTILVTKEQWAAMRNGQPSQMSIDQIGQEDTSDTDEEE